MLTRPLPSRGLVYETTNCRPVRAQRADAARIRTCSEQHGYCSIRVTNERELHAGSATPRRPLRIPRPSDPATGRALRCHQPAQTLAQPITEIDRPPDGDFAHMGVGLSTTSQQSRSNRAGLLDRSRAEQRARLVDLATGRQRRKSPPAAAHRSAGHQRTGNRLRRRSSGARSRHASTSPPPSRLDGRSGVREQGGAQATPRRHEPDIAARIGRRPPQAPGRVGAGRRTVSGAVE